MHTDKVLSILEMTNITPVPKTPAYIKGIINLRGTVLPVIDARVKLGMQSFEFTSSTCIIVFEVSIDGEITKVGALVDAVQEVLELDKLSISPPPSICSRYRSDFIIGVTSNHDSFTMIIDIDAILSSDGLAVVINKEEVTDVIETG